MKLRFTLAISLTHLSMFQVYDNILIFPWGFFLQGIHSFFLFSIVTGSLILEHYAREESNLFNGKVFFQHLFTFISYVVWIQLSYCML